MEDEVYGTGIRNGHGIVFGVAYNGAALQPYD